MKSLNLRHSIQSIFCQVGCTAKRRHELLQGRCMHTSHLPSPCNRCRTSIPLERMHARHSPYHKTNIWIRVHQGLLPGAPRERRIFAEGQKPLRKEPSRYELSSLALI